MSVSRQISGVSSFFRSLSATRIDSNATAVDRQSSEVLVTPGSARGRSGGEGRSGGRSGFRAPAGERGLQLVEFAVTLPITLLIFTGLLSFGVYLNKSIEMTNSTSLAGQNLAISRDATTDPCATFVSAFQSVSPFLSPTDLSYTFSFNTNTTPPATGSYTGANCAAAATPYMVQGGAVTIQVTYPCTLGVYGLNLAPGCILRSQVTEIIQ